MWTTWFLFELEVGPKQWRKFCHFVLFWAGNSEAVRRLGLHLSYLWAITNGKQHRIQVSGCWTPLGALKVCQEKRGGVLCFCLTIARHQDCKKCIVLLSFTVQTLDSQVMVTRSWFSNCGKHKTCRPKPNGAHMPPGAWLVMLMNQLHGESWIHKMLKCQTLGMEDWQ